MVLGNQPLFRSFFNFKRTHYLEGDSSEKEKKSVYRIWRGVVQEAEKQFIRESVWEELQLDSQTRKEISGFSQAFTIF